MNFGTTARTICNIRQKCLTRWTSKIEVTDKPRAVKVRKASQALQRADAASMSALRHFNYKGKRAHGRICAAAYFVACICCISTGIARPRASLAPLRPVTFVNSEREDRDHGCVVYLGDV
ncbi:PREDICTED: uncharacterized protein LOC105562427 [Vollenhovia emeryi]|uniref:uncharacterized protein LOC105562427 n=1 Tax=Vollenhovia emeryi TaxID=411798 RepID=UPI0005F406B2|nr:PREDICTED: uncharacterized protein LOC105562427 [Vollenhovia emeryi]XP_011868654.1 PREDICTED: uncharacterized protein LOC105562427 [Vollenhovia emeryi]XP_011868655.1 PREDICTED: uncharacterized protein LOC105562427 [Vollenhovia emeryi]